jgi:hypothetical protein
MCAVLQRAAAHVAMRVLRRAAAHVAMYYSMLHRSIATLRHGYTSMFASHH